MRVALITLIGMLLLSGATLTMAQQPPAPEPVAGAEDREPPPPLPPDDPGIERDRPAGPRAGMEPGTRPHLPGPGRGRPGLRGPGPARGLRPEPHELLLQAIGEREPELARRLHRLHRQSPEQFRRVILEALMFRLEDVLDEVEARRPRAEEPERKRPERRRPPGPHPPEPDRRFADLHERVRELEHRHHELEVRSHELAERIRDMRAHGAPPSEQAGPMEELERTIHEQFEIRGELRRAELERIEREVQELRRALERMETGLEQRERQRGRIIDRRIKQLLGEEMSGW